MLSKYLIDFFFYIVLRSLLDDINDSKFKMMTILVERGVKALCAE